MIDLSSAGTRRCTRCGVIGHYAPRCPILPEDAMDETTARIAIMREECEALATEISQYETVMSTLDRRIRDGRQRIVDLQKAIITLRGRV